MAESLTFRRSDDRSEIYQDITPQIEALVAGESDVVANLANIASALKEALHFFWVGFYIVKADQLVLGPFQGPLACTRIDRGKGVCGHAWQTGKSVIVPNVEEFPGHIACSSASRSEIVVPVFDRERLVWGVLDVDSDQLNDFDEADLQGLERIVKVVESFV